MKAIEEYTSAGEFHTGLPSLSLPVLTPPTGLDDTATAVQITLWELDVKDYQCKLDDCQHNQQKAYALILGQCSQAIQDCLEAHASWSTVNDVSDMIELLKLIHSSIYQQATTRKGTHALIEAESALMQFHQTKRLQQRLRRQLPRLGLRRSTAAVLLLTKSDPQQYGSLVVDIENQHTRGQDGYQRPRVTCWCIIKTQPLGCRCNNRNQGFLSTNMTKTKMMGAPNNSPPLNVGDGALQGVGGQVVMEVMVVAGSQARLGSHM